MREVVVVVVVGVAAVAEAPARAESAEEFVVAAGESVGDAVVGGSAGAAIAAAWSPHPKKGVPVEEMPEALTSGALPYIPAAAGAVHVEVAAPGIGRAPGGGHVAREDVRA